MRGLILAAAMALFAAASALSMRAEPAVQVLGRDFALPQWIAGVPATLSDFAELQINAFVTNDLFGTQGMRQVAFVDPPIAIYSHHDWSEKERAEAGATTTSPDAWRRLPRQAAR